MNEIECVKLDNRVEIPAIAIGTSKIKTVDDAFAILGQALTYGYKHIDTAQGYNNENVIGESLQKLAIPRENYFLTGKLDDGNHTYEKTIQSFYKSLDALRTNYFDMFLIHSPNSIKVKHLSEEINIKSNMEYWKEMNIETWRALENLHKHGLIKTIGVSNFYLHHLKHLNKNCVIKPMVNQVKLCIGCYPKQIPIIEYCENNNVKIQAYSALGKGNINSFDVVKKLSNKYGVTTNQIAIKFLLQLGFMPIIRSHNVLHLLEDISGLDRFTINCDDLEILKNLSTSEKWGNVYNPDAMER